MKFKFSSPISRWATANWTSIERLTCPLTWIVPRIQTYTVPLVMQGSTAALLTRQWGLKDLTLQHMLRSTILLTKITIVSWKQTKSYARTHRRRKDKSRVEPSRKRCLSWRTIGTSPSVRLSVSSMLAHRSLRLDSTWLRKWWGCVAKTVASALITLSYSTTSLSKLTSKETTTWTCSYTRIRRKRRPQETWRWLHLKKRLWRCN